MENVAIIVAAGSGTRFGAEIPKQYQLLGSKTVLTQTVEIFTSHPQIDAVRVVIAENDKYYDLKASEKLLEPVTGGAERQDSVRKGLESVKMLNPKNVLVHDAARPFVTHKVIDNILAALKSHDAVVPVVGAKDSARYRNEAIDRRDIKLVQTPQGFNYDKLLQAHASAAGEKFTDDAQVVENAGIKVHMVEGDEMNIKVTTKSDLPREVVTRVGTGFDVHQFETGTHVTICGVKIIHSHGLKGHSDADVGLHALVDAILGAIGEGDIGEHFPPSQAQWKSVDSAIFVNKAVDLVKQKGARINNVDITIICEEPKMTPHKQAMKERVAQLLGIDAECVNIKATTTEKLGFTGRKEGIAAQAVAAISFFK